MEYSLGKPEERQGREGLLVPPRTRWAEGSTSIVLWKGVPPLCPRLLSPARFHPHVSPSVIPVLIRITTKERHMPQLLQTKQITQLEYLGTATIPVEDQTGAQPSRRTTWRAKQHKQERSVYFESHALLSRPKVTTKHSYNAAKQQVFSKLVDKVFKCYSKWFFSSTEFVTQSSLKCIFDFDLLQKDLNSISGINHKIHR